MIERWQPSAKERVWRARAQMLQRIRHYFIKENVLEVETQILDRFGVTDPNLENLALQLRNDPKPFFLHTSPEFQMKRMLADGAPDIYQVCSVFRDGEAGSRHQPEFRMLEWYRHGFDLSDIIDETVNLIQSVTGRPESIARFSYSELFNDQVGVDHASTSLAVLRQLARDSGLASDIDKDACLDFLMEARVTRHFPPDRLTVIHNYPATQASLAQLDPGKPSEALRFEVYAGPLELANGFVELANADEQTQRFESDQCQRQLQGKPPKEIDRNLIDALAAGFPACAGVAIGLDRLLMSVLNVDDIRQVQSFPLYPENYVNSEDL